MSVSRAVESQVPTSVVPVLSLYCLIERTYLLKLVMAFDIYSRVLLRATGLPSFGVYPRASALQCRLYPEVIVVSSNAIVFREWEMR